MTALQIETKVLPGKRIEISAPELVEGKVATVTIVMHDTAPSRTLREIIDGYMGPRSFKTAQEVDEFIKAERAAWDE